MDAALPIAMRWVHIASVIVLLGGIFYARVVVGDLALGFNTCGLRRNRWNPCLGNL